MVETAGPRSPASNVQISADALIQLRTTSPLARQLGIACPYDHLFQTEGGAALAALALSVDPVYEQFNLVRYAWFSRRVYELASRYAQLVVLGAGFDTRSLSVPQIQAGACRAYEVDYPDLLSTKHQVLAEHGVVLPAGLTYVGCDLNADDPITPLTAAGFDPSTPAAIVMEGVFFFLRGDRASALLVPRALGLTGRSELLFDAWTATRARCLNEALKQRTGRALFGDAPLGDSPSEAAAALQQRGYAEVEVTTLDHCSREYGLASVADPLPDSWLLIEARVSP